MYIDFGVVLEKPSAGEIDHPRVFASINLSKEEKNYTTTEREGLAMVYALQNFKHSLLGGHFKMYTDHYAFTYLVNKPVLGGKIYRCLLLFQEYDFEVIVKPGRLNAGPNNLSQIEIGEEPIDFDEGLSDVHLFMVCIKDNHFSYIFHFLTRGMAPKGYNN